MVDSQAKGKRYERVFALYLNQNGWPSARRMVRTGSSVHDDEGDIVGTPGICFQVKAYAADVSQGQIDRWLGETDLQAQAAGCPMPILVVKRPGTSDPGQWWAWVRLSKLMSLKLGLVGTQPVRLTVATMVALLHLGGYALASGGSDTGGSEPATPGASAPGVERG